MKNKKMLFICLGILCTGLIIISFEINLFNNTPIEIVSEKNSDRKINFKSLSIMLETGTGSGKYQKTTDTTWAQIIENGYIFNENMSRCQNDSTLTWDDANKIVMFSGDVADKCYVYFDKATLAKKCKGQNMASCMATNYELNSSIYYHDGQGKYGAYEAGDYSYRFAGNSQPSPLALSNGYNQEYGTSNTSIIRKKLLTIEEIVFDYGYETINDMVIGEGYSTFDEMINDWGYNTEEDFIDGESGNNYYLQYEGSETIYNSYAQVQSKAKSDGYLEEIHNYVCFGTTTTQCPDDNLYRIIGIFDGRIKLIKYDYATTELLGKNGAWSGSSLSFDTYIGKIPKYIPAFKWNINTLTNIWSESDLNTVNLNTNYLNNLGTTWQKYIDDTDWKVGGNTWENIGTIVGVNNVYNNEIVSPAANTTYRAKIGLMYVSDYMYAANPANSNSWRDFNFIVVKDDNWMYMGGSEWTITRDTTDEVFTVDPVGYVSAASVGEHYIKVVRPVFFIKSSVTLTGGTGTQSDPYTIGIQA